MDIFTHTLSGFAIGASVATWAPRKWKTRGLCMSLGMLGASIPDLDVISYWSGFDRTIGSWFHLTQTGREIYGGDWWYSHHNFTHSIFCALILTFLGVFLSWIFKKDKQQILGKNGKFFCLSFALAYCAHLLGDLPTPAGPWGGIKMFWPLNTYVGGSAHIWWWNNYDIFLLCLFAGLLILGLQLLAPFVKQVHEGILSSIFMLICCSLILVQIHTRQYNYSLSPRDKTYRLFEDLSLQEQKRILGDKLFFKMQSLDNSTPIAF